MEIEGKKKEIWKDIQNKKRFIIKIGTNSLLEKSGKFDYVSIAKLVKGIKILIENGKEVLLVSSGAISAGMKKLGLKERPNDIVAQQAIAAIGNPILMNQYSQMFEETPIAQVLLTQHDLSGRSNYMHLRNALEKMLSMGIVPIINENDVVSIDELAGTDINPNKTEYNFSDNDVLSALTTGALDADVLIILSDVNGLYTKHPNSPKAEFIDIVEKVDDKIKKMGQKGGKGGRGGMKTKILAAEIATKSGAYTVITSAKDSTIDELISGNIKCTIFLPEKARSKKSIWLIYATNADGKIVIDEGAKKALKSGASLLLPGIRDIQGNFVEKEVVQIIDENLTVFAKGIVNYSLKVLNEKIKENSRGVVVISHENMEFID
ncbi:MAG: glutamate 5-kinase [archaeon]|nr:glutamate 5-kinase [archaeon]